MTLEQRNQLILNYLPLAESIAEKRNWGNPDIREEFRSIAYEKLVEAAEKCTNLKSFSTYARFVIDGGILDYQRRTLTRRERFDKASVLEGEPERPHHQFFEAITTDLSPLWKNVLLSYYRDGYTQREVGAVIGCNESRVCQILKEIRQYIKEHWDEADLRDLAA